MQKRINNLSQLKSEQIPIFDIKPLELKIDYSPKLAIIKPNNLSNLDSQLLKELQELTLILSNSEYMLPKEEQEICQQNQKTGYAIKHYILNQQINEKSEIYLHFQELSKQNDYTQEMLNNKYCIQMFQELEEILKLQNQQQIGNGLLYQIFNQQDYNYMIYCLGCKKQYHQYFKSINQRKYKVNTLFINLTGNIFPKDQFYINKLFEKQECLYYQYITNSQILQDYKQCSQIKTVYIGKETLTWPYFKMLFNPEQKREIEYFRPQKVVLTIGFNEHIKFDNYCLENIIRKFIKIGKGTTILHLLIPNPNNISNEWRQKLFQFSNSIYQGVVGQKNKNKQQNLSLDLEWLKKMNQIINKNKTQYSTQLIHWNRQIQLQEFQQQQNQQNNQMTIKQKIIIPLQILCNNNKTKIIYVSCIYNKTELLLPQNTTVQVNYDENIILIYDPSTQTLYYQEFDEHIISSQFIKSSNHFEGIQLDDQLSTKDDYQINMLPVQCVELYDYFENAQSDNKQKTIEQLPTIYIFNKKIYIFFPIILKDIILVCDINSQSTKIQQIKRKLNINCQANLEYSYLRQGQQILPIKNYQNQQNKTIETVNLFLIGGELITQPENIKFKYGSISNIVESIVIYGDEFQSCFQKKENIFIRSNYIPFPWGLVLVYPNENKFLILPTSEEFKTNKYTTIINQVHQKYATLIQYEIKENIKTKLNVSQLQIEFQSPIKLKNESKCMLDYINAFQNNVKYINNDEWELLLFINELSSREQNKENKMEIEQEYDNPNIKMITKFRKVTIKIVETVVQLTYQKLSTYEEYI